MKPRPRRAAKFVRDHFGSPPHFMISIIKQRDHVGARTALARLVKDVRHYHRFGTYARKKL